MSGRQPDYHLAQLNIARAVAPMDHERLVGFVSRLDEINGLGEGSPGFVWRLELLAANGPTAEAFNFKKQFDPPNLAPAVP
ncbi:MAG: DUF3291 domain-containing protein [Candidatus Limnocylindrales bacterium]